VARFDAVEQRHHELHGEERCDEPDGDFRGDDPPALPNTMSMTLRRVAPNAMRIPSSRVR
jgi:hypothetical protein